MVHFQSPTCGKQILNMLTLLVHTFFVLSQVVKPACGTNYTCCQAFIWSVSQHSKWLLVFCSHWSRKTKVNKQASALVTSPFLFFLSVRFRVLLLTICDASSYSHNAKSLCLFHSLLGFVSMGTEESCGTAVIQLFIYLSSGSSSCFGWSENGVV